MNTKLVLLEILDILETLRFAAIEGRGGAGIDKRIQYLREQITNPKGKGKD